MDIIKFLMRLLIFLVALVAVVVLAVVGSSVVLERLNRPASAPAQGAVTVERRFEIVSPEELLLTVYLWVRASDVDRPMSDDPTPISFTIHQGETALDVANRLQDAGLISDAGLFRMYMRYNGIDSRLEAGDYQLNRTMTMAQVAQELQHASTSDVVIRIVEGWRAEQIADLLELQGLVSAEEFMQVVRMGQFDYDFLAGRPAGATLEGFLFPDTYRFANNSEARAIVDRMLANFGARIDPERRSRAADQGLTLYEALTMASIVEREAVVAAERPLIASVYLNRLRVGMYLQADPTVQYALGYQPASSQWWLLPLTTAHYSSTISPYNTYLNPGLPPGPICNPGRAAFDSVLEPAETEYYFFLARGDDGSHVFSKTFEEHLENLSLYR